MTAPVVGALLLAPAGCATADRSGPAAIHHVVLIKLKDPSDARELISDTRARLSKIREVKELRAGTPIEARRAAADSDFSVELSMWFDSDDAYRRYLENPAHTALVAAWRERIADMRVIDVQESKP
ncbi:MAG TPA: Dabb family protein [Phycisphaerales bacterium]|nr:Dabb family protein [Phycisphaerales bacterium]